MYLKFKTLNVMNENCLNPTGGLGVHVRDNSNELSKLGVDVVIIGIDYSMKLCGFFYVRDRKIDKVKAKDWGKKRDGWYRVFNIFSNNDILSKHGYITKNITEDMFIENMVMYLKDFKFNIIHLHDSCLWRPAKNFALYFRSHIITTCHLSFTLCHPTYPNNVFYMLDRQQEGVAFQKSNKVISVSKSYGKDIKKLYFLPKSKVVNILNGINFKFLRTVKYNINLKKKYDKPLVVFVGRLVPSKGVQLILEVIKKLKKVHFILISNIAPTVEAVSPLVKKIKKMEKRCKNFEWLNQLSQEKKWELMKIADVGLMPSIHEPFGLVALEWMSLGVPLMVTQVDGLKEFCNNLNSIIIKNNSKDIINKIKFFNKDTDKISKALNTAEKMTWKDVAKKTYKVYEEVLKNG